MGWGEEPTSPLIPTSVGSGSGHEPKPACDVSIAHAQMSEARMPTGTPPPSLYCLLQVGSSPRRCPQDGRGSTEGER